ncbi:2-isopropylmalate synthase [uncultured Desulfosarcina sp.]|uniref:2-isopropylmalate synthase n=1 Tax=uncultured Desulfosarcina sp. TaxID=218289 RepID=UPI0029C66307|nr:2-isopropylmalate synthase [uncultured Desulfosarcina sp.]
MTERVKIFDTTLRDGEQSPGASMNTNEKLRLAIQLEKLGVDVIEAGFPAASEGDLEAVTKIAQRLEATEIAGLARTNKEDIDLAWSAVQHAAKPRIHTFIATSDLHLKYKLKMSRDEVLNAAVEAVRYAKTFTENVEFSAEDGSRSDRDYLCKVFGAAIEAGATTINLPDTVGYAIPKEFEEMVRYVIAHTPNMHKATLSVHCHNDLGLATANTVAAINAGARQAEVTINGIGERAGNTSMEEVVMALHTRNNLMPFETGIRTEHIYPTSRLVSMITGIMVQPNKAIVGANAFAHEAGIHQDGVLKNPMTYEIMKPETIGLSKNQLVLGKHSGRHALHTHLKQLGYDLSDEELKTVFKQFKALADRKKHVMDEDLEALVTEGVLRSSEVFKLEYLHVTCGTTVMPMASVKLSINDRSVKGANYGNGPIDSAFNTIAQLTGTGAELLRFTVSALTGGTDAQGEVTVRLRENGLVALGRGSDPDIITASAKAYVNGLNRLEYLKAHPVKASQTL